MKLHEVAVAQPTLYVAIGPSGAGKSTYFRKLLQQDPNLQYYSWDALRHEFYDPDNYHNAWQMSTQDPTFRKRVDDRFRDVMSTGNSVYVDNTNVSPKARRPYLQAAKKLGYRTVGIVFRTPLETVLARQKTRTDKSVPDDAVRQQWMAVNKLNQIEPTEFDSVIEVE